MDGMTVAYNTASIFMEGKCAPFQLCITPQCADISELFVEIRRSEELVAHIEPNAIVTPNQYIELNISYTPPPGHAVGIAPFRIYVGYRLNKKRLCYYTEQLHHIYQAAEKNGVGLREVKIEINNNVTADRAGRNSLYTAIPSLDHIIPQRVDPSDVVRLINPLPKWVIPGMNPCHFQGQWPKINLSASLDTPLPEAHLRRLTLHDGIRRIHLLTGSSIVFGRNRACDMVTRLNENPVVATNPSGQKESLEKVSNYHGRLELQDGHCTLVDQNYNPTHRKVIHSHWGLFVDGRKMPTIQPERLPLDRAFRLCLGSMTDGDPLALCYQARIYSPASLRQTCPSCPGLEKSDSPCGMLLTRNDVTRDIHLVVWSDLPLRIVDTAFSGWCICVHQGSFALRSGASCNWLIPGKTLAVGGRTLTVSEYQPFGLKTEKRP